MTKLLLLLTLLPFGVFASGGDSSQSLDLTEPLGRLYSAHIICDCLYFCDGGRVHSF